MPMETTPERPVVSFTFDDFPRSAASAGAQILEAHGGRGTFYACTGLSGTCNHSGELFLPEDLVRLARAGHEIGAHSDAHGDMGVADPVRSVADIRDNIERLKAMGVTQAIRSFAYPYGETDMALKFRLKSEFATARGVLPGINRRGSDLMQLRAAALAPAPAAIDRARRMISDAVSHGGWVVLFTHDVREDHSPYGVSPAALEVLVRHARDLGARILPVGEVIPA